MFLTVSSGPQGKGCTPRPQGGRPQEVVTSSEKHQIGAGWESWQRPGAAAILPRIGNPYPPSASPSATMTETSQATSQAEAAAALHPWSEPFRQFEAWYAKASESEPADPNAMSLA